MTCRIETSHENAFDDELFQCVLADNLIRFLCRFKGPGWKDENEWRLVYAPESGDSVEIKKRDSGDREIRYIELDLSVEISSHGAEAGRLPIREVMHGPTQDSVMALTSLESLLCRYEYISVHPSGSAIWP